MARILGLDLGAHTVKAVLFESAMRGFSVKSFTAVARGEGERMETLSRALGELFEGQRPQLDQVVVALPGPALASHSVSLPFVEPKRIEATLPFEVESAIPFDLKDVVFDYQVGLQHEKKSDLVVGVVRKDELTALLETLKAAGLDPRVVTHPALTYQNLLIGSPQLFEDVPEGAPVAIVDIGHERVSVCIGQPGSGAETARTFPGGGKELTRALAAELRITPEEAAAWKEQNGALASQVRGPDQERAAQVLVRAFQPVIRELRATFKAHAARSRRNVSAVYLCGGTAALPGLVEHLTSELQLPVRLLPLPIDAREIIPPAAHSAAAQPYTLGVRGLLTGAKAPRFNFRRGDLAFKGDFDYLRERVGRLAVFAAVIIALLVATGIVRNSLLRSREAALDAQLCETTQRVLGSCEKDYRRALSMLRGQKSPAAAIPKKSAVNLLAELIQKIPPEMPVTLEQLTVDLSRISVRVVTDSSKQLDTLHQALKSHKCFREVSEGKVEKSADGKKVKFKLDINVACPDEAQASQG